MSHVTQHTQSQALVHSVLSAVRGTDLPHTLVASIDAALRKRKVLNARLAEEVSVNKACVFAQGCKLVHTFTLLHTSQHTSNELIINHYPSAHLSMPQNTHMCISLQLNRLKAATATTTDPSPTSPDDDDTASPSQPNSNANNACDLSQDSVRIGSLCVLPPAPTQQQLLSAVAAALSQYVGGVKQGEENTHTRSTSSAEGGGLQGAISAAVAAADGSEAAARFSFGGGVSQQGAAAALPASFSFGMTEASGSAGGGMGSVLLCVLGSLRHRSTEPQHNTAQQQSSSSIPASRVLQKGSVPQSSAYVDALSR